MGFDLEQRRIVSFLTEYARKKDDKDELVIPEDLSELSEDELTELHGKAVDAFNGLYNDGDVSEEDLGQLQDLAEGIEQIRGEVTARETEKAERSERAAEIAARVTPPEDAATDEPTDEADGEAEAECEDCDQDQDQVVVEGEVVAEVDAETGEVTDLEVPDDASEITDAQPEPVAASAAPKRKRKDIRINMSGLRSKTSGYTPRPYAAARTMNELVTAAPDLPGFANGEGMDYNDLGQGVSRRLQAFSSSEGNYRRAAQAGRHLRQQFGVAVINKPIPDDLMVMSEDPGHIDAVIQRATDESRLDGGSLVASGGWCAPSETIYDLCELESRDGLFSIPEIGISRGGIRWTQGPDFAQIYADTGFCYTEEEDEAGDYDGYGGGSKPCFKVDCPDFDEARLNLCGTCITAGLLQTKGYPEMIARTIRGALTAGVHRVDAQVIQSVIAGSDPVSFTEGQVGTTAPILTAIELQAEHVKYRHRMSRNTTLEATFPFWVRGAIRSDLSRRLGVDLIDVTDARIDQWFRARGINPQFVYNWQGLETLDPADAVAWPNEVSFLLYPAGTWVKGTSPIISLDTVYDSTMLGTNDYTALFTEEGWLTAKLCHDSRVVTVPICPDGATHAGVDIACDGTAA